MKQIFLTLSLFIVVSLKAQPFLSIGATTKGAGFSIGYLDDRSGIEFSGGYNVHPFKAGVPRLYIMSVGKRLFLTQEEADNVSITASIGCADYSAKDFSEYERDKVYGEVIQVKKIMAMYGLELGKDQHLGRFYISANYCGTVFWGIGLRAFIK